LPGTKKKENEENGIGRNVLKKSIKQLTLNPPSILTNYRKRRIGRGYVGAGPCACPENDNSHENGQPHGIGQPIKNFLGVQGAIF
jgi:hypothetical protein